MVPSRSTLVLDSASKSVSGPAFVKPPPIPPRGSPAPPKSSDTGSQGAAAYSAPDSPSMRNSGQASTTWWGTSRRSRGKRGYHRAIARGYGAVTAEALEPVPQSYDIAVEATGRVDQLALAVTCLTPEGICESHFRPGELPLLDMYLTGVTLRIARDNVRARIPDALELAASGKVARERVVSHVIDWEELPTALP